MLCLTAPSRPSTRRGTLPYPAGSIPSPARSLASPTRTLASLACHAGLLFTHASLPCRLRPVAAARRVVAGCHGRSSSRRDGGAARLCRWALPAVKGRCPMRTPTSSSSWAGRRAVGRVPPQCRTGVVVVVALGAPHRAVVPAPFWLPPHPVPLAARTGRLGAPCGCGATRTPCDGKGARGRQGWAPLTWGGPSGGTRGAVAVLAPHPA